MAWTWPSSTQALGTLWPGWVSGKPPVSEDRRRVAAERRYFLRRLLPASASPTFLPLGSVLGPAVLSWPGPAASFLLKAVTSG